MGEQMEKKENTTTENKKISAAALKKMIREAIRGEVKTTKTVIIANEVAQDCQQ